MGGLSCGDGVGNQLKNTRSLRADDLAGSEEAQFEVCASSATTGLRSPGGYSQLGIFLQLRHQRLRGRT